MYTSPLPSSPNKNHNVGIYFCIFVCVFSFNVNQICKFMLASTQQRTSIPFDEQGFNILNIWNIQSPTHSYYITQVLPNQSPLGNFSVAFRRSSGQHLGGRLIVEPRSIFRCFFWALQYDELLGVKSGKNTTSWKFHTNLRGKSCSKMFQSGGGVTNSPRAWFKLGPLSHDSNSYPSNDPPWMSQMQEPPTSINANY